jgi:hypothetical protein
MRRLFKTAVLGLTALALLLQVNLMAQERGGRANFDPDQIRAFILERFKGELKISDDEWVVIRPLVENVMAKQMDVMGGNLAGLAGRFGGGDMARRFGLAGGQSAEAAALEKAVQSGTGSEMRAKLREFREARQKKESELQEARERLRKVLTIEQEARLVLAGILD